MFDASVIYSFVVGYVVAGAMFFFFYRRLTYESKVLGGRVADVEAQLSRQAEEFSKTMSERAGQHASELDRLTRERREMEDRLNLEFKDKLKAAQEAAFRDGERQAKLNLEEKARAFSVTVRPFIRKTSHEGWFKKFVSLEVGYQYQLLINGIPCFEPHVVISKHHEERELNKEVLDRMTRLAIEAAHEAVRLKAGPAGELVPIAACPIIEEN